ncbi:hypothetical protein [Avibacterium sp. 21-599]|uniref:hypothetical protein n=1 Tax=Avibacterium sp. 21-599 TaxID=2911528 RepID=UPI00224551DC|nr:hypothetical protein [Avibacterium sp. 21-599]MCW9717244.1 hypothetical protein [Avibacterium sp. 21-599]
MKSNRYLKQQSQFITQGQSEAELRQQLKAFGVDARRLSKFTQLCLLGALPLKPYITPNTAIYLASPFNSPSKFNKLFHQLMEQDLPSPLDFMANLNNATVFQLSQHFQTTGNSLFLITSQEDVDHPLQLAQLALRSDSVDQVLVGWAIESPTMEWEGSCWWLLSNIAGENALSSSAVQNSPNFSTTRHSLPENHYLHFALNGQNFDLDT